MSTQIVYVVVQEGGSSAEAYASSYDSIELATEAMAAHTRATYRAAGPHEMRVTTINGKSYVEEGDALLLAEWAAGREYEYVDGVEVGADEDGGA